MAAESPTGSEETWLPPMELQEDTCYGALIYDDIDVTATMDRVRSPKAGAIVLFAGTTRDNFGGRPVVELDYSGYNARAIITMLSICRAMKRKYSLISIAMIHRLGKVPIGKESIVIAVSAAHRKAAWRAGEDALEECKRQVEVWKTELLGDIGVGVWRANRDEVAGIDVGATENGNAAGAQAQADENGNAPDEGSHGPIIPTHETR